MRAVKANRSYRITEAEQERYRREGFDIIGEDGNVLLYGSGKNVPRETYETVKAELEATKAELAAARAELTAYAAGHPLADNQGGGEAGDAAASEPEKETKKTGKK